MFLFDERHQALGVTLDAAVRRTWRIRQSRTREIERIHRIPLGQLGQDEPPAKRSAQKAVNQQQRRPVSCLHILNALSLDVNRIHEYLNSNQGCREVSKQKKGTLLT